MTIKEITPDKNDMLYEPRKAGEIEFHKNEKKQQFKLIAISGTEILCGLLLTAYAVTKLPNMNPMIDVLMGVVGCIACYDAIKRIKYK